MSRTFCVLTGIYPPETGGPAKFAATFSEFLLGMGIPSHVITYTDSANYNRKEKFGSVKATSRNYPIIFRYLRTIYLINKHIDNGAVIVANGCFIEIAILRLLRRFKYAVKIPGDIVWERARNNSVTSLNILEFQNSKLPNRYRVFRFLFSYAVRSASTVIVPSSQLKYLAISWGAHESQVEMIYNSVRLPTTPERILESQFDFVTVSRLVPWKGMDQVIKEVCAQGFKLLIIGDGPERKALEETAAEFPGLVDFTGEISANEVKNWLIKANYFILNSSFEATSYALLEAMSLGLIPIANSGTGSEEVIKHKVNGLLCGETTSFSLGNAITYLIENQEEVQIMRVNARKTIEEKFNLDENYLRIINRCIHGN
jgi:glycosyltransferase involved in cell wall biosynthesis